jgi:predicted permease
MPSATRIIETVLQDAKYGLRLLAKTPGFTLVAVLSLAIGIGAAAAVYSTVDWLLNRPAGGVVDSGRLVSVQSFDSGKPAFEPLAFSYGQYEDLRTLRTPFTGMAAYFKIQPVVSDGETADQAVANLVTGNYFSLLGVPAALGRILGPEDDVQGGPLVAMISYDYWQQRFGGDPQVLGRSIRLNGHTAGIIGVVSREFEGYSLDWSGSADLWLPLHSAPAFDLGSLLKTDTAAFPIIARLAKGETLAGAKAQAENWVPRLRPFKSPAYRLTDIIVRPGREMRVMNRDSAHTFFVWAMSLCGLILFASCFNTANFLLDQAMSRRGELAMRMALGATPQRLSQQVLVEAGLIGVAAAGAGALIAVGAAKLLAALPWLYLDVTVASGKTLSTAGAIDIRMAGFAVALGLASTLSFGLLPSLLVSFRNPAAGLKSARPLWRSRSARISPRQMLLVLQIGVAVALIAAAGLYLRSFANIAAVEDRYTDADSLVLTRFWTTAIPAENRPAFYGNLLQRLEAMAQVESVSFTWNPPLRIGFGSIAQLPERPDSEVQVAMTAASPSFFATQGIPMAAGREFDGSESDLRNGIIVNRVLAEKLWPDQDAVGRTLAYAGKERIVTGVTTEDRCRSLLGDPSPCLWIPFSPAEAGGYMLVRTRGAAAGFIPALHSVIDRLNPEVALVSPQTFASYLRRLTGPQRTAIFLSTGLALVSIGLLLMGSISLFLSTVRNGAREIATRSALGETEGRLAIRIVAGGMSLTALGILLGIAAALVFAPRIAGQLYETKATDLPTFAGAALLVAGVGLVASYWSAVKARKIERAQVLKAH